MLDSILLDMSERSRTLVISSHDPVHVADLVSRLDVLSDGKIVDSRAVTDIGESHLLVFYREAIQAKGEQQG